MRIDTHFRVSDFGRDQIVEVLQLLFKLGGSDRGVSFVASPGSVRAFSEDNADVFSSYGADFPKTLFGYKLDVQPAYPEDQLSVWLDGHPLVTLRRCPAAAPTSPYVTADARRMPLCCHVTGCTHRCDNVGPGTATDPYGLEYFCDKHHIEHGRDMHTVYPWWHGLTAEEAEALAQSHPYSLTQETLS